LLGILGFSGPQPEKHVKEDDECPLDEIEVKKDGPNRKVMADYSYWFHHY
jgi:hypothetical protein